MGALAAVTVLLMLPIQAPGFATPEFSAPSCWSEAGAQVAVNGAQVAVNGAQVAVNGDASSVPGADHDLQWIRPEEAGTWTELDRWCQGVGPPITHVPDRTSSVVPAMEDLVFVSWNTHVGGGDLDALIQDLRTGRLTGAPVPHFVLLLQEVYRAGRGVPSEPPTGFRSAERIGARAPARGGGAIDEVARRHDLHLFYAPSMRNGHPARGPGEALRDPPEDRGNAILSTLPLSGLQVVELPVHKQRRVVIAAQVEARFSGARRGTLRVVGVHLDHVSGWKTFHQSFGGSRGRDAEWLVATFAEEDRIVVGGDFNSWFGGSSERAIQVMRAHFPEPVDPPRDATHTGSVFLPSSQLDHLFFRMPDGWGAEYSVAPERYGSDHLPLIGRLHP